MAKKAKKQEQTVEVMTDLRVVAESPIAEIPAVKEKPKEKLTSAQKIWNEIKDKELNAFGINGKIIGDFCVPLPEMHMDICFLVLSASSLVPEIEKVLVRQYKVEQSYKYILISRK
jgi:hypothetical protein